MSTNFPSSLDTFTTPSGTTALGSGAVKHTDLHSNEGDAIEALQAKLGADNSAVSTSIDFRIRALEAEAVGVYHISSYGGVGDGSTNNDSAMAAAMADASAAGGGRIVFPPGTFVLSDFALPDRVGIQGAGRNTVLKADPTTSGALVNIANSATGVVLENFSVDGDNVSGVDGINFNNTGVAQDSLHRLTNLWVYNAGRDGVHLGPAVIETNVENVFAFNAGRHGFHTEVGATDNRFANCTAGASVQDGFFIAGNNTQYSNCKAFYSGYNGTNFVDGYNGFTLRPGNGEDLHGIVLVNCEAQNNSRNGYYVDGSASSAVCTFIAMRNCFSDGNNMVGSTGTGFAVYRTLNSSFSGLLHRQQSPTGSCNYGLALFSDLSYTTFDGCYFEGSADPVYIDGGVTGPYRISGCPRFNPRGPHVSQPSVPGSGSDYTNGLGVDCMVYISGGTVSNVAIGGTNTGLTSGWFPVPAGQTIKITYTGAPSWTWWGD